MAPPYLDFDLRLYEMTPGDYRVAVVNSPVGEITEALHLPFTDLEKELLRLENAVLRSAPQTLPRRRLFSDQEREAQSFGLKLFDALFSGNVRSLYDQSRISAGEHGLRIRLRINDPKLAAIPWEFLYDPRGAGGFVALNLNTPIVRYVEVPYPARALVLRQDEPIRILGMTAAPDDQVELDTEQERQNLQNAVKNLPNLRLEWVQGETWRDLVEALEYGAWHVFHFIGHGLYDPRTNQGVLALCTARHTTHALSATELAVLIADHYSLRFVFLNSCEGAKSAVDDLYSSTASILVGSGIPAVLAMQYEIYDASALEFSRTLYTALARGDSVDRAVTLGRKAIKIGTQNVMEWGTPVLTLRLQDGVLFRPGHVTEQLPRFRTERAEPALGQIITDHKGLQMVYVPPGTFWMGCSEQEIEGAIEDATRYYVEYGGKFIPPRREWFARLSPRHQVIIEQGFWLDRTPVTNAAYRAFIKEGYDNRALWTEAGWEWVQRSRKNVPREFGVEFSGPTQPSVGITWFEACAYAKWRGCRLATEAEWEWAARGDAANPYPWGLEFDGNRATFVGNSENRTASVDSRPQGISWCRALDLCGNVWEWTSSLSRTYPYNSGDGREDKEDGTEARVVRGGSWYNSPDILRTTVRGRKPPFAILNNVGFRCVKPIT